MKIIKTHKYIINKILSYKGDIVVCGLSETTKAYINQYKLEKEIKYIFDNNTDKNATFYQSIKIIDYKKLSNLNDTLIIIWGNHNNEYYQQIKDTNNKILMEYQNHLSKTQNLTQLLDSDFIFEVETPNFQIKQTYNNSHNFSRQLINQLILLNKKIITKAVNSTNQNYSKIRKPIKNSILFSYHSYGQEQSNIIRYKDGYIANTITFDLEGYSGWSSLCEENIDILIKNIDYKKANTYFEKLSKHYITNNQSKYSQPTNDNFDFPKEFIFFPLQTLDDSVMQHSYFKPFELIKKIIKILNQQNISLVIKEHPRCQNKKLKEYLAKQEDKGNIILFNGSIHDAIKKAKTIYTINSGVGFEALFHLKPVITFGKSDYMSITKNISNLDIIKQNPYYFLNKNNKIKIIKFIYYYLTKKYLYLSKQNTIDKFIYKIIKNYLKD